MIFTYMNYKTILQSTIKECIEYMGEPAVKVDVKEMRIA